jgi:CRP-like cAMP-binding protein
MILPSLAIARLPSFELLPDQTISRFRERRAMAAGDIRGRDERLRNELLLDLSPAERDRLLEKMEPVALPARFILNEAEKPIEHAYFINGGCASILKVMTSGKSVEVGLVGSEGFIGSPLLAGFRTSPAQVIMQVPGSGFRISAENLEEALGDGSHLGTKLGDNLERYTQELGLQAMQTAACNRLHEVEQRLARWLLMTQDRAGRSFDLTQDFLAHTLGTRRATVTIAAGLLQDSGLITYSRGRVHVKDRVRLERSACECYSAIQRHIRAWRQDRRDGIREPR